MADGYNREAQRTDWMSGPTQDQWARLILGEVDLDPCAHENQIVQAKCKLFGEGEPGDEDDGYTAEWTKFGKGRIYINPDWGERPPKLNPSPCFTPISKWVEKMAQEGKLGASVLFVGPASTETHWFHNFIGPADVNRDDEERTYVGANAFCLVKGRIKFRISDDPEEKRGKSAPTKSNVVAIWTEDPYVYDQFVQTMDAVGIVVENNPLELPED